MFFKSILKIITIFFIFAIGNITFASDSIDNILGLNKGLELYKLNEINLKDYNFKNKAINRKYYKLKIVNRKIKRVVKLRYNKGKISKNKMNGFIKNYKHFIFYTNSFFENLKIYENNNYSFHNKGDLKDFIISDFKYMKIYFREIKKNLK